MVEIRTKQEEVDRNFAFFQSELQRLLLKYRDKYALLRDKTVVGYFDTALDAQTAGEQQFKDGLFSIQRVSDEVIDLGLYSHAVHLGAA